jgi:hypothetical protein
VGSTRLNIWRKTADRAVVGTGRSETLNQSSLDGVVRFRRYARTLGAKTWV